MKDVMSNLTVVKRSGQRVSFNGTKIALAVKNAFDSVYDKYDENQVNGVYESVLKYIIKNYSDRKTINVEDVQDIIENKLKENGFNDVYEAFNLYRLRRAASREVFSEKQQHKFVKAIEKLVFDQKKHEINFAVNNFNDVVSTEFTKAYILENKYLRAHEEGIIYINDLNLFPTGIVTKTHLCLNNICVDENYINNLTHILLAVYSENRSECSIGSIDLLLNSWLIFTFKQIFKVTLFEYLELEGLSDYISLNQLHRVIEELNTIKVDINTFERYALNDKVKEIFIKSYNNSINKLEKNISLNIFRIINSLNRTVLDGNFSLSLSSNKSFESMFIKNIIIKILDNNPRFDNVAVFIRINDCYDDLSMIINLLLKNKNVILINKNIKDLEYFKNGEKIYENILNDENSSYGRPIISSSTINLARIAFKNKKSSDFYTELSDILELIKNQLLQRFEYQGSMIKDNFIYLYNNNLLLDNEKLESGQRVRKVIKNGAFNINISGLVETINILCENENDRLKIGLDIITFINKKIKKMTQETKLNFIFSEQTNCDINKELLSLDKSIYGLSKGINDYISYKLINDLFSKMDIENDENITLISKYQKQINFIPSFKVSGKLNEKKILNVILKLKESNIDVYKIEGEST